MAFRDAVTACVLEHQRGQLLPVIRLLEHVLNIAFIIHNNSDDNSVGGEPQLSPNARRESESKSLQDRLVGGPTILVAETNESGALLVKMKCPVPLVVERHSKPLANLLQAGRTQTK